jgi:RimJ/RimL family protein N-acetyltransferase
MKGRIVLNPVKKEDYIFLYELLLQRRPSANISHKKMPTWEEHVKFVKSKPYTKWYIITQNTNKIGAVYLSKQNEIGIHLLKKYEKNSTYIQIIMKLMTINPRKQFLANVSPKNQKYIKIFAKLGFKKIQHTYELDMRTDF